MAAAAPTEGSEKLQSEFDISTDLPKRMKPLQNMKGDIHSLKHCHLSAYMRSSIHPHGCRKTEGRMNRMSYVEKMIFIMTVLPGWVL